MTPNECLIDRSDIKNYQSHGFDTSSLPGDTCMNQNTYPMMIKLIEGSLDGMDNWQSLFDKNKSSNEDTLSPIPTMTSIAVKVALEDGTKLDSKQIVTYETICSTFLLQLVNDGEDDSSSIGNYFTNAATSVPSIHSTDSGVSNTCESSMSHEDDTSSISSKSSSSTDTNISNMSYQSNTSTTSMSSRSSSSIERHQSDTSSSKSGSVSTSTHSDHSSFLQQAY